MEGIRSQLEGCPTGKDTINKIWSFAKDDQLKVVVLLWRWWTGGQQEIKPMTTEK